MGLFKFNIKVEIITGTQAVNSVHIPRIILDIGEFSTLPFIPYRRHLLIVMAFIITINKSLEAKALKWLLNIFVGRCFLSHLYVTLSRCINPDLLFIKYGSEDINKSNHFDWQEVFDC